MIGWLRSLLRNRATDGPPSGAKENNELRFQYEAFLLERLDVVTPSVRRAFLTLTTSDFPDKVERLHLEIFLDAPPFSLRLFGQDNAGVWADIAAPVKTFNDTIDRLWPIVTQDEMDAFMIWEDDPQWGRQVALEQPIDMVNVSSLVIPWLRKIAAETSADFRVKIAVSVHDFTLPEPL